MWEHPWVAHVGLLSFFFFFWPWGYFWFGWLSLSSVFADHHPFDVGVKVHMALCAPKGADGSGHQQATGAQGGGGDG